MLLLLMRRRGSPRVPPGVAACMQVCETERARGGPVHAWARAASGAGLVWGEGARCVKRGQGSTVRRYRTYRRYQVR